MEVLRIPYRNSQRVLKRVNSVAYRFTEGQDADNG